MKACEASPDPQPRCAWRSEETWDGSRQEFASQALARPDGETFMGRGRNHRLMSPVRKRSTEGCRAQLGGCSLVKDPRSDISTPVNGRSQQNRRSISVMGLGRVSMTLR
jgi:hypothetical protein